MKVRGIGTPHELASDGSYIHKNVTQKMTVYYSIPMGATPHANLLICDLPARLHKDMHDWTVTSKYITHFCFHAVNEILDDRNKKKQKDAVLWSYQHNAPNFVAQNFCTFLHSVNEIKLWEQNLAH